MCGIFGYARTRKDKAPTRIIGLERFMFAGFPTSIVRGTDGSGMFTVDYSTKDKDDSILYYKKALQGGDFIQLESAKSLIKSNASIAVGHVRAKTRGATSDENSHPFCTSDIILVHNGTLDNEHKFDDHRRSVDSHVLVDHIHKVGLEQAIAQDLHGAFAIALYNQKTSEFQLIRNDERPLGLAFLDDGEGVIFASELNHLQWLCERESTLQHRIKRYAELPPGQLLTITDKIHVRELKVNGRVQYINYGHNYGGAGRKGVITSVPNKPRKAKEKTPRKKPEIGEVLVGTLELDLSSPQLTHRSILDNDDIVRFTGAGEYKHRKIEFSPGFDHPLVKYFEENRDKDSYVGCLELFRQPWLLRIDNNSGEVMESYAAHVLPTDVTSLTRYSPDQQLRELLDKNSYVNDWVYTHGYSTDIEEEEDGENAMTIHELFGTKYESIGAINSGQEITGDNGVTTQWSKVKHKFLQGCCYCAQEFSVDDIYLKRYDWYLGEPIHLECLPEAEKSFAYIM